MGVGRWSRAEGRGGGEGSRLSHIHTLRVEAGDQGVLQVARVTQEVLGSGARRRVHGRGDGTCEETHRGIR